MGKGYLMCNEIHEWINNKIPKGGVVLELGSGKGTKRLSDNGYKVYSIEHSKKWINKYDSTYIYAPIKDGWYDADAIKKYMPGKYDILVIDGPPRKLPDGTKVGRGKMIEHLDLFNTDGYMIFDDSDRGREIKLLKQIVENIGRNYIEYKGRDGRGKGTKFAIFDKVE